LRELIALRILVHWRLATLNVSKEITNRLTAANRSYFGPKSQLKSHLLSRKTEILIYKTLVRPVLTHAAETWTTTKNAERSLSIFERKTLRRMYGAICELGQWRKRYNRELEESMSNVQQDATIHSLFYL